MNPIAWNILAAIVGFVIGSVVNMGLVSIGMAVVPLPEGADTSTMEGLREAMKSFTPVNFLFPFLAHALGTLAGAFVAAKLAASHHMKFAIGIGVCVFCSAVLRWSSCAVVPCGSSHPTFCWRTYQWGSLAAPLPAGRGLKLQNKALNLPRCCRAEFLVHTVSGNIQLAVPEHAFHYLEIVTPDVEAMCRLYSGAYGWHFQAKGSE